MKTYALILLFLILILWWVGTFTKAEHFTSDPVMPDVLQIPGDLQEKILIIGGVHGNEPAGTAGIMQWLKTYVKSKPIDKSEHSTGSPLLTPKLVVIPNANIWGLANDNRYLPRLLHSDLNRNFTKNGSEPISKFIVDIVNENKPILVVDFHEGWGFHKIEPDSIGSTVTSNSLAVDLGNTICDKLNDKISDADKKFTHRMNIACDITSTLGCMCEKLKIPYILVETTGQNNRQPLDVRTSQVCTTLNTVIQNTSLNAWN